MDLKLHNNKVYPPSEFSQKFGSVLAPKGKLLPPSQIFGENGVFKDQEEVEQKTRQAFKITLTKLEKLNMPSSVNKEDMKRQKVDQIIECFPEAIPKKMASSLQKVKWGKTAKEVENWDHWWTIHDTLAKTLGKTAKVIGQWWPYTSHPDVPSNDAILDSLKRLVSGVMTHPLTIGKMIAIHAPKRKLNRPKSVHLMGTDRPECTMIYGGFFSEILSANPNHPIKLTLVSPDEGTRRLSEDCSPEVPMLLDQRCKLTAWAGLYHDFWDKYVEKRVVERPDVAIGIHPGLHADEIYEFWEPTIELLLDQGICTAFTVLTGEEYKYTLEKLDNLFVKYIYKGINPFRSMHVKQTLHNADIMWASNMYLIVFKGRTIDLKTLTLITDNDEAKDGEEGGAGGVAEEDDLDKAEQDFDKLVRQQSDA